MHYKIRMFYHSTKLSWKTKEKPKIIMSNINYKSEHLQDLDGRWIEVVIVLGLLIWNIKLVLSIKKIKKTLKLVRKSKEVIIIAKLLNKYSTL
jgi:hypothetical protein